MFSSYTDIITCLLNGPRSFTLYAKNNFREREVLVSFTDHGYIKHVEPGTSLHQLTAIKRQAMEKQNKDAFITPK